MKAIRQTSGENKFRENECVRDKTKDVHLAATRGKVLYTTAKESDLGPVMMWLVRWFMSWSRGLSGGVKTRQNAQMFFAFDSAGGNAGGKSTGGRIAGLLAGWHSGLQISASCSGSLQWPTKFARQTSSTENQ